MPSDLTIHPGAPAFLVALGAPGVAVALLGAAAAGGRLDSTEAEIVSPWLVAALTLLGAAWLAWRALSQVLSIDDGGLSARNVSSTLRLEWDQVESIEVRRRFGLCAIDVRVSGLRRRIPLGAAARLSGPEADRVLATLSQVPAIASRLTDDRL